MIDVWPDVAALSPGIRFTKMHGAGNDYVYIYADESYVDIDWSSLARYISDRHFGVGGDGLVVIMGSEKADFRMRMFNADGSEAQMCGNASRCIGKFVYDKGLTQKTEITLETLAGIKRLSLKVEDGHVSQVTVDMGSPEFRAGYVPVRHSSDEMIGEEIETDHGRFNITAVSMGNPHGVIFTDMITDSLVHVLGPELETHPMWPARANIEFCRVIDRHNMEMRVWERGSGETLACGTGACASVAAAVRSGLTERKVAVALPGGKLEIFWDVKSDHIFMTGEAVTVADGIYYLPGNFGKYVTNKR